MKIEKAYYEQNIFYRNKCYSFPNSFNKLVLPTNRNFYIGVDQSTSAVGISIIEQSTEELVALIDLINNFTDKRDFMEVTVKMIKLLTKGGNVPLIVMEDIYDYNEKLFSLRTLLKRNFKEAKFVKPPVWRKGFLAEENTSAKREIIKGIVINKVLREHPELLHYCKQIGKDFDSLEAYGIIKGYLARQGKINVTMSKYKGKISLEILTPEEVEVTPNMIQFEYNSEMTLEENARRAVSVIDKDKVAIAEIARNSKYIIYSWDKGLPITPDTYYYMKASII